MGISTDLNQQKVLEGSSYKSTYLVGSLGNTESAKLRIRANNSVNAEVEGCFKVKIEASTPCECKIYLGSTYTSAGTTADGVNLTQTNKDFREPDAFGFITEFDPVVDTLGDLKDAQLVDGSEVLNDCYVMDNTMDVLIDLTNTSGVAESIDIIIEWYEVVI